jgi:hypothetical protein
VKKQRPRPEGTEGVVVDGLQHNHPTAPRLAFRANEIAKCVGISLRALQRERSAGRFPAPDQHVGRMPIWRVETVKAWLEGRSQ